MAETTGPTTTGADGWCHWHQGSCGTARMVQIIEQSSGPGRQLYACGPCRDQHHLTPVGPPTEAEAWQAYIRHTYTCKGCTASHRCDVGQPLWDTHRAARNGTAVTR